MNKRTYLYKQHRKKNKSHPLIPTVVRWFLICMLLLALSWGIMVLFSHTSLFTQMASLFEQQRSKVDLSIKHIVISGIEHITEEKIREIIGCTEGDISLEVDIFTVKKQLEQHPWVARASVRRDGMEAIIIAIEEEVPQALFEEKGRWFLINHQGRKLEEIDPMSRRDLVQIMGVAANLRFAEVLHHMMPKAEVYKQIESLRLIDERRWDVKLKNGLLLKLPADDVEKALEIFVQYFDASMHFKSNYIVDLRLIPGRIYLKEMK
jgi:cell division protein FtsQ